ncbi:MAG: flavodoxin [Lachnospiraceae bacterium]|nr:flavodoxin [Lachnospiraceae bacterium]
MKVAVVYWSGSGNTQEMANYVAEGAKSAGAETDVFQVSSFGPDKLASYDGIAFGCPSMGSEELEDSEFAPVFSACESGLKGKKVGLFGSYGWGSGEWMQNWEETCRADGARLVSDGVIANGAPGAEAAEQCRDLGSMLAQ